MGKALAFPYTYWYVSVTSRYSGDFVRSVSVCILFLPEQPDGALHSHVENLLNSTLEYVYGAGYIIANTRTIHYVSNLCKNSKM